MIYPVLRENLYKRRSFQRGDVLDEFEKQMDIISEAWIRTVAAKAKSWKQEDVDASLSTLFDTLCSALYARDVLSLDRKTQSIVGIGCGSDLIFPYTWMCPRCVSRNLPLDQCYLPDSRRETEDGLIRDYPVVDLLAKPGARAIGDVGIKVLRSILRTILRISAPTLRMSEGGGRRGEFDLTFASTDLLIFGEVKAKPLIAFPVIAHGAFKVATTHRWHRPRLNELNKVSLYVAAADDLLIDVGFPTQQTPLWPLETLASVALNAEVVGRVVTGWRKHLDAYRAWRGEPDALRWHRFGCGNFSSREGSTRVERRVANTKELPGLDRTDDIKKGASQVLLFSRFKLGCEKQALKSSLLGNVYAETHGVDYLDHLAKMKVSVGESDGSVWIFDMIVGLTKNVFNDCALRDVFDTTQVVNQAAKIGQG